MSLHPRAREAFAKAENKAWGEWSKRNADGTWTVCAEPEPFVPSRRLYEPSVRSKPVDLECEVSAAGEVTWDTNPPADFEQPRKTSKLEKWLALSEADRAPFRERAQRHMPEASHKDYADYGGYCLYARGLHHPYSALEYRAVKGSKKRGPVPGYSPAKKAKNASASTDSG